ncbi:hypothetical protein BH23VER1_BH23VER1_34070 [soil metagenome]
MLPSTPDDPPSHWDRDIVFFANLLSLFFGNESQTKALADTVGEVDSYGGRLLPVLDLIFRGPPGRAPQNLLVLERPPDPALCDYFTNALGLSLPRTESLTHHQYLALPGADEAHPVLQMALGSPARWVDGYVTDPTLEAIAARVGKRTLSSLEGSHRGNNKLLLHQFLEAQGLPTIPAEVIANQDALAPAAARLVRAGFTAGVLKSQVGASGIGMEELPSLVALASSYTIPEPYFYEGPCLLQGWLAPGCLGVTAIRSPSVQMFLGDTADAIAHFDITEQILGDSSVHQGNVSPAPYLAGQPAVRDELLRQARIAARWLHDQGYRGTASADFLLATHDPAQPPHAYLCEINARVTGATYPSVLARHLLGGRGAWLLRNLRLSEPNSGQEVLADLAATRHLYQSGAPAGILPVNFNFGPDGTVRKGQFLCLAANPAECHDLLELAASKLPTQWSPDRD